LCYTARISAKEEVEMPKTYCLQCDCVISVQDPHVGDVITCPECDQRLEIIDTDPLEVDYPLDDDWDDDWDDEEEEGLDI
jgi:Zn finger protein HypA/HybF involved in hydrogenase expression